MNFISEILGFEDPKLRLDYCKLIIYISILIHIKTLMPDTKYHLQKLIVLMGRAGSGKSTLQT